MKKILIILLALMLVLAFAAGCKTDEDSANGNAGAAAGDDSEEEVAKGSVDVDFVIPDSDVDFTLDDVNVLEEPDPEANFRSDARVSLDDMEVATTDQD